MVQDESIKPKQYFWMKFKQTLSKRTYSTPIYFRIGIEKATSYLHSLGYSLHTSFFELYDCSSRVLKKMYSGLV